MNSKPEKRQYVNVDELQSQISVSQLAQHYGYPLPPTFGSGGEQRMRCPCRSCRGNTDDRSVSINTSDPFKRWKCYRGEPGSTAQYGCGAKGNLVTLAYAMKHGQMPPGGKATGREFFAIAEDLRSIAGDLDSPTPRRAQPKATSAQATTTDIRADLAGALSDEPNLPLSQSPIETARKLSHLDHSFERDPSAMSAAASAYCRRRPPLLSEALATECRCGYLPAQAKSTLRGQYVYGIMDESGEALAWAGRNVTFAQDMERYETHGGKTEPIKYRFPKQKLFRRGQELYGQEWINHERFASSLSQHGLIVCEGFNARLRLHQLDVMSVSLMSNQITEPQIERLQRLASTHSGGRIQLMFDLDEGGNDGAKETLWKLHQRGIPATLLWSNHSHAGRFTGRDPETVTDEEWHSISQPTTGPRDWAK